MKGVQEAKQAGRRTADELGQRGEQAVERAEAKAQETADQAKGKIRQEVDSRSQQVAEQVASTADAMRKVSEELREQGKQQPAQLLGHGAERAERLGRYLDESDAEGMLHDIEDLARKKPWAAAAGGMAAGFAFSRFLKASSSRRHQSSPRAGQAQHDHVRRYGARPDESATPAAPARSSPGTATVAAAPTPTAPPAAPATRRA